MKRKATKEEQEHMRKVATLGCMVCGAYEVEIHHCRINTGMGVRPSHFQTISLCTNHHRGKEGIHTIGKKTWEAKYGTQQEMLDKVKVLLEREY